MVASIRLYEVPLSILRVAAGSVTQIIPNPRTAAARILWALPRWIARPIRCYSQNVFLSSSVTSVIRRPISAITVPVVLPYTPPVSTAMGANLYLLVRAEYFRFILDLC